VPPGIQEKLGCPTTKEPKLTEQLVQVLQGNKPAGGSLSLTDLELGVNNMFMAMMKPGLLKNKRTSHTEYALKSW
jgi:hypothetical protein